MRSEKEAEEVPEDSRLLTKFIAPVVGLITVVVIAFSAAMNDPWYARLKDWQTLITGLLAIFAAYITVLQMRISDERAEERHRDLMGLSLRKDISRFVQFRERHNTEIEMRALFLGERVESARQDVNLRREPLDGPRIVDHIRAIRTHLKSEEAVALADMLSADLHRLREQILAITWIDDEQDFWSENRPPHGKRALRRASGKDYTPATLTDDDVRRMKMNLEAAENISQQSLAFVQKLNATVSKLSARISE